MTQQTSLYMRQHIRAATASNDLHLLQGIGKTDETCIGGNPRKGTRRDDDKPSPRERATRKIPAISAVERGGAPRYGNSW